MRKTSHISNECKFYNLKEAYGSFSNFSNHAIEVSITPSCVYYHSTTVSPKHFQSVEHFFQWTKFHFPEASKESIAYSELISQASTPNKARILALQLEKGGYAWRTALNKPIRESIENNVRLRPDWEQVKQLIMYDGIRAKFQQHTSLLQLLLDTNELVIIENSPRDSYWGIGKDGNGENHLGKLLMSLRQEFKSNSNFAPNETLQETPEETTSTSMETNYASEEINFAFQKAEEASNFAPTNTSNWLLSPSDRLLTGSYPGDIDIVKHEEILHKIVVDNKVNVFISLMEENEQNQFNSYKDIAEDMAQRNGETIKFFNFPICDRKAASTDDLLTIVNFIDECLENPKVVLYLHCHGGHGRTGLVSTFWLAKKYHIDCEQAKLLWYIAHNTRKRKTPKKLSQLTKHQSKKLSDLNTWWSANK